jgi:hypothetical protein
MEEHRRTEAGRVRTAKELVAQFFPWSEAGAKDLLFHHMPQDVRGPILSGWGIRGAKAALRDDDEKVKLVVADALSAGDIDEAIFEEGVSAQILIDWIPLGEWWHFWRNGKLTGVAIQKALATARELALIDDKWFLLNVQGRGGKLKGTDVLCDTLSKDQIVAWVRRLHETGDGSPAGIIGAIGWETVLAKTAQDALLFALDQFARKASLVVEPPPDTKDAAKDSAAPAAPREATAAADAGELGPSEAETKDHDKVPEQGRPTINAEGPPPELIQEMRAKHDSGFPVAIPDIPAIDSAAPGAMSAEETAAEEPPSIPSVAERSLWAGNEESPRLAEARAAMMAMLKQPEAREAWDESEVPAKPSSLEWPEPPPIVASTPAAKTAASAPAAAKPAPAAPVGQSAPAAPAPAGAAKAAPPPKAAAADAAIAIDDSDVQPTSQQSPRVGPAHPPPVPKRGIPRPH